MIRSVEVETIRIGYMMKFRNVCTAITSFPGLLMTLSTQIRRVTSFT